MMKNPKKMHKRILGVAFLGLAFIGLKINTHVFAAETMCDEKKTKPDSSSIAQRYGFVFEHMGGNDYKLSMTSGCAEGVTFKITSINEKTENASVGKDLSCANPVTITVTDKYPEPNTGLDGLLVKMKSNEKVKDAPKVDSSCYWAYVEAEATTTLEGTEGIRPVDFETPPTVGTTIVSAVIDCDNNTYQKGGKTHTIVAGSFEDKFCNAKRKATEAGNAYDFGSGKFTGDPKEFKCETDFKAHPELVPSNPDELEGDAYFVNKKYLYGESKMSESATLEFHYAPSYTDSSVTISCEITCKEAVEVEYGPPVASAAGVCFEYIVRVTSRVSCNMTKEPAKTELCKKSYCTPYPHCVHSGGTVYTQGGPSEVFDACVKNCDGGKYTKSCSNKCYKQVYGTSSAYAKVNSTYHDDLFASKVMLGDDFNCNGKDGYYDKSSENGSISWNGGDTAGRWYCENSWHPVHAKKEYKTDGAGFFRHINGNSLCNDDCSWRGCGGKQYLNRYVNGVDVIQKDCEENTKKYNDLVASCQKKAMCSTTASEFTISVDYTKLGETTKTTLNFPYNGQKDRLQNKGNSLVATTQDQKNTTLLIDYPSEGEGTYGCYKNGAPEPDLYRSTWSFPGSWMNIKTGEISYNPDGKDRNVWYNHPHRFCIPGDAAGVNVLWYNAFMNRVINEQHIASTLSSSSTYIDGLCQYTTTTTSITEYTAVPKQDDLKFNILATTRKFGYLEWDIDIKCLYAINEDPVCKTANGDKCYSTTEITENCTSAGGYRVHSVDLGDVFPNEDGASLTDKSKAGRTYVGYNWSEYAINNKNEGYKSNPPAYLSKIQANAKSMYEEGNLDYEFYLSPETIRDMRKLVSGTFSNYTSFSDSGFGTDENGISHYKSPKIRDSSLFDSSNSKVPSKDSKAISCNNMINWSNTSACDNVHG